MWKKNLLLLGLVAALAIGPLAYHGSNAGFNGSDGQAQELIAEAHPTYQPWATPFWTPPSKEIESLLFALQAAIGAGLLGYYFGRRRGLAEAKGRDRDTRDNTASRASH